MTTRQALAYALIEQFIGVTMPKMTLSADLIGLYVFLVHKWVDAESEVLILSDETVRTALNCEQNELEKMRTELQIAGIITCQVVPISLSAGEYFKYTISDTLQ